MVYYKEHWYNKYFFNNSFSELNKLEISNNTLRNDFSRNIHRLNISVSVVNHTSCPLFNRKSSKKDIVMCGEWNIVFFINC